MVSGDLFVVSVFTACTVIQKVLRAIAKQKGQKDNAHLAVFKVRSCSIVHLKKRSAFINLFD